MTESGPVEVWRGAVQAWECDEMGHMNVRFHLAKAMQGLAGAAAALGMPHAFCGPWCHARAHDEGALRVALDGLVEANGGPSDQGAHHERP